MTEPLQCVSPKSVITGWDFSTGGVKCLAFDLEGNTLAETRLPTDLWIDEEEGVCELSLTQLEGQARASTRAIVAMLREQNRLKDWVVGGISATHHTAGRIDENHNPVRRAICWNDNSLARYHKRGLARLGGQSKVRERIGGPWAIRYGLSHLVKDAEELSREDWERTKLILSHGSLAAGYLTGQFGTTSVSSAASTGIMDLRTKKWSEGMLNALEEDWQRELAKKQLPRIIEQDELIGPLADHLCEEVKLEGNVPLIFPTSDDQQAGLVGGGAVEAGQVAIILGNSAVVNSSSDHLPKTDNLDAMRLNWGPYLWMRCYNNGAQFLDHVIGEHPNWEALERDARKLPPGSDRSTVLPFLHPEPSLNVSEPRIEWSPALPENEGKQLRTSLEAIAYLIALGVQAHEEAGQKITRITVSGGIARSDLMCEILASVLNRPLSRLVSFEGPALGAAVTALAALESYQRKQSGIEQPYQVADAVAQMVKFRDEVKPNAEWVEPYAQELQKFAKRL